MQKINNVWCPTVTNKHILGFFGEYRWLSNFHMCPVEVCGISYPSAEHAYQAYKTLSRRERQRIAKTSSPGAVKRYAQTIQLRPNWDSLRVKAMYKTVWAKFSQNPELAAKLIDTHTLWLEETNYWGDVFWGTIQRQQVSYGQNHLGHLLMRVRTELQSTKV